MKRAFTLAEVLITLTIIGVIAALTIPNLMQKWSDHADVQKVKQAYSILNNAYKLCIEENGTMETWDWGANITFPLSTGYRTTKQNKIVECMIPYIKVEKYCGLNRGCGPDINHYTTLYGTKNEWGTEAIGAAGKAQLATGMTLASTGWYGSYSISATGSADAALRIDINGAKGPNRYGYDVFFFNVTPKGITPVNWKDACNKAIIPSQGGYLSGVGCASYVIRHSNMDYKYRDVSAEW